MIRKFYVLPGLCLFVSFACAAPQGVVAQVRYTIQELLPDGAARSGAIALNNQGDVVVKADYHYFLYHEGKMRRIAGLNGGDEVVALNDRGDVAGNRSNMSNNMGFLLRGGKISLIGKRNGPWIHAWGMNSSGDVVGAVHVSRMRKSQVSTVYEHAFLYHNGKMRDLGPFQGAFSAARAISNRGEIVGSSVDSTGNFLRAFHWRNGKMQALDAPAAMLATATAVNERGDAAGIVWLANGSRHAFLWSGGKGRDLGAAGAENSYALYINRRGDVAGGVDAGKINGIEDSHPGLFMCADRAMKRLDSLLPENFGWQLIALSGMNNRGTLIGFGLHHGKERAFLMQPVSVSDKQAPPTNPH